MTKAADYAHIIERKAGGEAKSIVAMAVVLACFAAVALVTTTRLQHVRWRLATTLGLLTYPLYLVHEYWGLFVISQLAGSLPRPVVLAGRRACSCWAWPGSSTASWSARSPPWSAAGWSRGCGQPADRATT